LIKRIRFAARSPEEAAVTLAPPGARPLRITGSVVLPELSEHSPPCAWIGIEWFTDAGHLARFENWLAGLPVPPGRPGDPAAAASVMVVASEHALRGEPWLERRWLDGGERLKHMALATRAAGLSAQEFSRRWRAHAGTAGATPIPEQARGHAYVQNHPVPGEWPYDAVNEVYFDDLAALRERVDWFRRNVPSPADGVLFGQSWLIAVREIVRYP
jgi:hypothetical protein